MFKNFDKLYLIICFFKNPYLHPSIILNAHLEWTDHVTQYTTIKEAEVRSTTLIYTIYVDINTFEKQHHKSLKTF